jgi:hypothetical protein
MTTHSTFEPGFRAAMLDGALVSVDNRVLGLAILLLAGMMPTIRIGANCWLIAAFAFESGVILSLIAMRTAWRSRIRRLWEGDIQRAIRITLGTEDREP